MEQLKDGVSKPNGRILSEFLSSITAKPVHRVHGGAQPDVDPPAVSVHEVNSELSWQILEQ